MRCVTRAIAFCIIVLAALPPNLHAQADPVAEADAAFNAGDHQGALLLYDRALQADPKNVHAWVRTGLLLSWKSEFEASVERYDRALALNPNHPTAGLERAKVLSWNRKYRDSQAAFRKVLATDSQSHEARIGLARAFSWSGDQIAARREYELLLEGNQDDAEALIGIAQTYAWSGQPNEARGWYRRALSVQPGSREALMGLAYLDLGEGNRGNASRIASDLNTRFPADKEIADLRAAIRRSGLPSVSGSFEALEDTDANELDISRLDTRFSLPRGSLNLALARFAMTNEQSEGSIDSFAIVWSVRPTTGTALRLRAGVDSVENTLGEKDTRPIGGLSYRFNLAKRWDATLSADRDSFRYSTAILDAGIEIDAFALALVGHPGRGFRTEAIAGAWNISDGNERQSLDAGLWYQWPVRPWTVEVGYLYRSLEYDLDLNHGYFDPQNFDAHVGQLLVRGQFGSSPAHFDLALETGTQSFTAGGRDVSNDQLFGGSLLLGFPIAKRFTIELFGSKSDYAAQSGSGFESEQVGVRIRIPSN